MSSARTQAHQRAPVVALVSHHADTTAVVDVLHAQDLAVAVFDDIGALLEQQAQSPAVIVVCVDDAVASPASVVEPLTRRFAQAPVVVLGSSIPRRAIRAALAAGAAGVALYDELESTLGPCLLAVRAGQLCVPRRGWQEIEPPALSSREKQVLGLVVMGYMNSQIAEQLFLAESTVKSHLSSAFDKLGVRSRHEAVARILDPDGGLGVGILTLGGEPLETVALEAR
jgi:DNA-binding NarL/FixJ family response regulator